MSAKHWMIRTHTNQILGPVSKEKLTELISKNALKENDEICQGNGYWFYVRESELVNRFIKGNEEQGPNPITETCDVLTNHSEEENDITTMVSLASLVEKLKKEEKPTPQKMNNTETKKLDDEEIHLPKKEDLEFPDEFTFTRPSVDLKNK